MDLWIFIIAAALLSIERMSYAYIWRFPEAFRVFCDRSSIIIPMGAPIDALRKLFYGFKLIQLSVFFGWCYYFGAGSLSAFNGGVLSIVIGSVLILVGQIFNFSVFYKLGKIGVFYGNKFGYDVPRTNAFPFSLLKHPQYIGTLMSIWGFFIVMRYPYDDWAVLPILQTLYYILGVYFEQEDSCSGEAKPARQENRPRRT